VQTDILENRLIRCMWTVDALAKMVAEYSGPFSTYSQKDEPSDSDRWGTIRLSADILRDRIGRLIEAIDAKR